MRWMPIQKIRPGMKLGKNIYSEDGTVLLSVYAELTQRLIDRLAAHDIEHLYIDDPRTDDVVIPEPISEATRIQAMKTIRSSFRQVMEESTRKKTTGNHYLGKPFRDVMYLIIDDLSRQSDVLVMLNDIQITDFYLYQHSLNVCIYSTILGMAQGYTRDELMMLGLGALLHDIGKMKIPLDLLRKPGKLTDEEFAEMKRHSELGYLMLKDEPNISLLSAHCAFQHHERIDGTGYPRGIKGEEIHDYARWIGIVDTYDAMTTNRVYRSAMLPHQAMEILYGGAGTLFDKAKIELFRDRIAIYPLGMQMSLNTGETGVIIDMNASSPQRPIVRILENEYGEDLAQPYEIDLSKNHSLIISVVGQTKVEN